MTDDLSQVNLVLFFSGGMSLKKWSDVGILDREVALYKKLQGRFNHITFVSYGGSEDSQFKEQIGDVRLVLNKFRLPQRVYERSIAVSHPAIWRGQSILKTNQIVGSEAALRAAKLFRKKLVVRCGYLLSLNCERKFGKDSAEAKWARRIEANVLPAADRIVVTTAEMSDAICERYHVHQQNITVIPNYVDTSLFSPGKSKDFSPKRIIFIGRLEKEKNLYSLLEATKELDVELIVIGSGSESEGLKTLADRSDLPVRFLGTVPHNSLPGLLRSAGVFILASHYEGNPKVLLEAMACGTPVIGADSPGIRELIDDGVTGLLCDPSPDGIRQAIASLISDDALRDRLRLNATRHVVENYSLDRIVELEMEVYKSMGNNNSGVQRILPNLSETEAQCED